MTLQPLAPGDHVSTARINELVSAINDLQADRPPCVHEDDTWDRFVHDLWSQLDIKHKDTVESALRESLTHLGLRLSKENQP